MLVITLYNSKGGSAKSTLAASLGGVFATARNLRVLLIDGDPQRTLSRAFPIESAAPGGYRELIQFSSSSESEPLPLDNFVSTTTVPYLDIVQSNTTSDELNALLRGSQEGHLRLRLLMDRLRLTNPDRYDVVIIDSNGAPDIISYTCAIAADVIVSPIIPDRVNVDAFFSGAVKLLGDMSLNRFMPYHKTPIVGTVVRVKPTKDSKAFVNLLQRQLEAEAKPAVFQRLSLANTMVPESAAYPKAASAQRPISDIDPNQANIILALANELLPATDEGQRQ